MAANSGVVDGSGRRGGVVAGVAWSAGVALLCWLAGLHLGVVFSFAVGARISPAIAPLVTAAALAVAWRAARRQELTPRQAAIACTLTSAVIASGVALAGAFFDLTWDGQWYHQTAVYEMSRGWNPIHDPVPDSFDRFWKLWVMHYAKGPWFWAIALYQSSGNIETAKAASAIAPVIACLVVLAVGVELGLSRGWAFLVALLVALNPVTTCGIVTHQVDGILVSLLACAVAAGVSWLRRPGGIPALALFLSAALCANTKFTGLVYLCFFALAGGIYCLWRRRDLTLRYGALTAAALVAGLLVFGYNPYVTNTVHRGHPFYPVQGSAEHPGLADQGKDPIEQYETPANMVGTSRFRRLAYGIFGRPGTAPYVTKHAEFVLPFGAPLESFGLYYFHDVRIGGFGPWFSGLLLLALVLGTAGCARGVLPTEPLAILGGAIVLSLLVSTHTWWARYGPHLWWLPILPLAAALRLDGWPTLKRAAAVLAVALLANTVLLSAVHMRWEWRSTQALRQQLADLRAAGPVTVDLQYFDVPVAERFKTFGVAFDGRSQQFKGVPKYECPPERQLTLMSVCRGYPDWVRVCLSDQSRAAHLQSLPHWQWSEQE